ncbi:hypothetical protein HDU76_001777, partial [Blyttiomyces sp. JEL0837]
MNIKTQVSSAPFVIPREPKMQPPSVSVPTDEEQNSLSVTVKAADGQKDIKGSRFPAVPVWLVVLSLVVVALCIVTLPCMTYPSTTTPPAPGTSVLPNITQFLVARDAPNVFVKLYRDWSNSPMEIAMISPYLPNENWVPAFPVHNPPETVPHFPIYNYLLTKSDQVEYQNTYTKGRLFTSAIGGVWDYSTSKSHISYACEVGSDSDGALSPLLESIKVTTNTHVFLMDSVTGILLANSVPGTCFKVVNASDPSLPTVAFTPDTTNDTHARDIGMYLKGKYGNYSLIPNMNQTVSMETAIGNTRWIINYRYLDTPNTYIVVVGIPRSDFFSKVDSAQQKALILACVLAAVGVIFTVICAWFAMRPLHTLTLAMEKLTKMDFTALE